MLYLAALLLLTVFFYLGLKKTLAANLVNTARNTNEQLKSEYERLSRINARLKEENFILHNTLEQTIALYDISKQICKTLEEDAVFNHFKEEIDKYMDIANCKFVKGDIDASQYQDQAILNLQIDKNLVGHLIADGVKPNELEKFHILAQQFLLGIKRAILYQQVQELSVTDTLTGAFSRRHYLERFGEELERSNKFKYHFSCLMIDIDHFKEYNDRYGHLVGDAILKEVSTRIKENIRQIDLMGRYGGEEFSIVLTETGKDDARYVAERIRRAIEEACIRVYDEDLKVTISIGISSFPADGQDTRSLIEKADQALYKAKETGRNRVCAS
jgi:diguanylate cyclase (GGDEF)-like protein